MIFAEGRGGVTILIEWDMDVDVLVTVCFSSPAILGEKSVVKLQTLEAAILG